MSFRHERLGAARLAGALLGLGGVIAILGVEALDGLGREALAQLAALLGAALYAGAAINGRRFAAAPPTATAAGVMLCASAMLVPASLVLDQPWRLRPGVEALAAVAVLGAFCTTGALMIYFRLVRTLGSLEVASQSYLRAGLAALLGVVVLGETLTQALRAYRPVGQGDGRSVARACRQRPAQFHTGCSRLLGNRPVVADREQGETGMDRRTGPCDQGADLFRTVQGSDNQTAVLIFCFNPVEHKKW